jgi:VanZ family protein
MIRKNLFSILTGLLLLYLSLANAEEFQKINVAKIPHIDKIVHFGMYFLLMSVIIAEHRREIKSPAKLLWLALIPLSYGIIIEVLQATITTTRSGDFYDALFDAMGILCSVMLWLAIKFFTRKPVR